MGKFDSKSHNGTFLGYSKTSKAYRVYKSRSLVVEEAIHMKFKDTELEKDLSKLDESFAKLRLKEGICSKASVNTNTEGVASTQGRVS